MKVLEINATYGFGSTGIIVQDIGKMLEENGDKCYFAFQQFKEFPENGYKIGNKLDRKIHAVYTRVFGKQGYASKGATRKLLKWVDEIKPDVVHLHNLHSNYINLNILLNYLAKKNIGTVITLHDCWFFTGKCTHFTSVKCDRWKSGCGNCPQLKTEVRSLFFDKTKKVLQDKKRYFSRIKKLTVVGCSEWIASLAKNSILGDKKITYIRNGVDTQIFKPTDNKFRKENNLNDKFVILGFASKWCLKRNSEAVEQIISNIRENVRIVLVGCNEEDRAKFSNYEKVICVGFIKDRNTLADIYSSSDVFINLTHEDTLPTVNMESICSGTPVITYNVTGSPELVDENSGIVVEEDDVDGILNAVEKIRNGKFIENRKDIEEKFSKVTSYKKYIKVFKELI